MSKRRGRGLRIKIDNYDVTAIGCFLMAAAFNATVGAVAFSWCLWALVGKMSRSGLTSSAA